MEYINYGQEICIFHHFKYFHHRFTCRYDSTLAQGFGAFDGVMVGFYSKAGISLSLAAPVTAIERFISFGMAIIIGIVISPHYGSSVLDKISSELSPKAWTIHRMMFNLFNICLIYTNNIIGLN